MRENNAAASGRLIIVPAPITIIAVPIHTTAIMVVAAVPVGVTIVGVTADVDPDVGSSLQIRASKRSRNEQSYCSNRREFDGPAPKRESPRLAGWACHAALIIFHPFQKLARPLSGYQKKCGNTRAQSLLLSSKEPNAASE
jgi:hypothetical protein